MNSLPVPSTQGTLAYALAQVAAESGANLVWEVPHSTFALSFVMMHSVCSLCIPDSAQETGLQGFLLLHYCFLPYQALHAWPVFREVSTADKACMRPKERLAGEVLIVRRCVRRVCCRMTCCIRHCCSQCTASGRPSLCARVP